MALRELLNLGFSEARSREALENIGDPSDLQLAVSWLLDHGEEDKGGAVEFKHCPHLDLGKPLLRPEDLRFDNACIHGCKGSENWVCLTCGESRCGRYMKKHSIEHWCLTKKNEEAVVTIAESSKGHECLGHFVTLSFSDLSVWCYECEAYVDHERLKPLVKRMESLKFGTEKPAAEPEVGTAMATEPVAAHGRLGNPAWAMPRVSRACGAEARPGYKTMQAHEFKDEPDVLEAKVKLLASLIGRSKACVAYTGAGISTASGIRDYATKASDSEGAPRRKVSPWLAEPTHTHRVLVALHKEGHLKHWVQQNHDGLPQKAGFPQKDLNEIHGAWWDPSNPVVPMDGTLRGDLIEWMLEWEEKADLCLALGTSMVGMNADRMAVTPAQRALSGEALGTVIVALQQTQYDKLSSLRIFAPMDQVMTLLEKEMALVVPAASPSPAIMPMPLTVPYGPDGQRSDSSKLTMDLRIGCKLRVVDQPAWDNSRHGEVCEVVEAPEDMARLGHVQLLFPGHDGRKAVTRLLGSWWLEAAQRGELQKLPVVPI